MIENDPWIKVIKAIMGTGLVHDLNGQIYVYYKGTKTMMLETYPIEGVNHLRLIIRYKSYNGSPSVREHTRLLIGKDGFVYYDMSYEYEDPTSDGYFLPLNEFITNAEEIILSIQNSCGSTNHPKMHRMKRKEFVEKIKTPLLIDKRPVLDFLINLKSNGLDLNQYSKKARVA